MCLFLNQFNLLLHSMFTSNFSRYIVNLSPLRILSYHEISKRILNICNILEEFLYLLGIPIRIPFRIVNTCILNGTHKCRFGENHSPALTYINNLDLIQENNDCFKNFHNITKCKHQELFPLSFFPVFFRGFWFLSLNSYPEYLLPKQRPYMSSMRRSIYVSNLLDQTHGLW